jgi:Domain of unknown function (DUF4262)
MHHEFEWPKAVNQGDETTFRHIREHGCSVVSIPGEANEPPCVFSVGLFANYDHPELIMFGMRPKDGHAIINDIRDRVAAGQKFRDGDISDDFLENGYKIAFWDVPFMIYPKYLGTAIWFYRKFGPFPCLQVIWQDINRRFPWEADCVPGVKADQPLLKMTVS